MGEYVQALTVGHPAGGLEGERPLDGVGTSLGRESVVHPSRPRDARGTGWARRHTAGLVLGDLLAALACSVVVSVLAHHIAPGQAHGWRLLLLWGAPLVWVAVLGVVQAYNTSLGNDSAEYRVVTRALLLVAAALGLLFLVADVRIPRDTVVPLLPAMFVASLGVHYVGRRHLYQRRLRGECLRPTIVVGRVDSVRSLVTEIATAPESGMHIVGACVSGLEGDVASYEELLGVPVLGSPESALEAVDAYGAEVVAVSSHPDLAGVRLRRLGWALAERQVELVVAPGIVEVAGPRLSLRPAAGVSLLHVERPLDSGARVVAKRIADAAMTGCLLVVALPVLLVIAVLVRVTSPGPVFYLQERVGTRGERFRMVKFRTMVVGADSMVATMSGGHDTNAVLFKQRQDPRVTAVGRVLRKYSLDELPQLFNVLVGQMSLVGPRPPLPREVDAYEPDAVQRLRVRPGMTGLWQISGRSDLSWEQSLRLDLWYVDNWSLVLDLQILVRTVKAVVRHTGAY